MVRGPVSMVIVGIVLLFIFGLVGLGPRAFEAVLPERAIVWLETMGGMDGVPTFPSGTRAARSTGDSAADLVRDSSDGWKAVKPVAALAGGGAAFVEQAIDGYTIRLNSASPGETEVIEPLADCTPVPPSDDAAFAHAAISGDTGLDLGLYTYSDEDLAKAAQVFVNVFRKSGRKEKGGGNALAYQAYDVAVTETARPVYLVVEATHGRRIVNLHLAPGARLERVVLLGADEMGVANLPEGVPVEVIRGATLHACGARPSYPLNPGHLFFQSRASGAIKPEEAAETEAKIAGNVAAWEALFGQMFGQSAQETLAGGWQGGTLAVAGPLPATPEGRAVYAPIAGAKVRLTVGQYVETAAMARAGQGFAARVEAIVTAFAWDDLENLRMAEAE